MARYNVGRFITNSRVQRHIIKKFTNKIGLVYFGAVNQHQDDNRLVRGFTVSQSHQDDHYSVGTVEGYNVTLVNVVTLFWIQMAI